MGKTKLDRFIDEFKDENDAFQRQKIERYHDLRRAFEKLNQSVKVDGAVIQGSNGNQQYTKLNPAVPELQKINLQLNEMESILTQSFKMSNNSQGRNSEKAPPDDRKGGLV
jgi:DNA repair ATPase RecN